MRAAYLVGPSKLELRDVPEPVPGPGELVVRVRAALTCGTDFKAFRRGHPFMPFPTPLGHEFSGDVVAAGPGARFAVGTPVMSVHTAPCGRCALCAAGRENLCPQAMSGMALGAYADLFRLPAPVVARNTFVKPGSLSYERAALLEPLACVVHALDRVRIEPGATVAIVGAGPTAILHLLLARERGAGRVVVAGQRPFRRARALEAGADAVVDASGEEAARRLREATAGGADLVIACVGTPEAWELGAASAARGGTVLAFGGCVPGSEVRLDTRSVHYDEVSLVGAFHFTPRDVARAHELLVGGFASRAPLFTREMKLADIELAFETLERGEALKLTLVP